METIDVVENKRQDDDDDEQCKIHRLTNV
jgi:hypothetical protein